MDSLTSDEISDAVWYVLLRAVERFQSTNGRLPGMNNAEWESDVNRLKVLTPQFVVFSSGTTF